MTYEETEHSTIDNLSPLGQELSEEDLAMAAGGECQGYLTEYQGHSDVLIVC